MEELNAELVVAKYDLALCSSGKAALDGLAGGIVL